MSHAIIPPRKTNPWAVVDMDGEPLSWHRSEAAAQAAIDAELRRFRRRYPLDGSRGNATAYLPRSIIRGPARIAKNWTSSTSWAAL